VTLPSASARQRAVFLDRDGVLNEAVVVDGRPRPPESAASLVLTPGVEQACAALKRAGFLLIVVTNQPDIARGSLQPGTVDAINEQLRGRLDLDDVLVCPHDDADGCDCRKPRPGMILEAARRWGVSLPECVMVGDRWRDIEAGRRAGCRTVWISRGYDEPPAARADLTVSSLAQSVDWIASASPQGRDSVQGGATMLEDLRIKIFADGADAKSIADLVENPIIKGFTTNPTLMRAAGVVDYEGFARQVLACAGGYPVSFEVFADDFEGMERQARKMAGWGEDVYVKVPITNTCAESSAPLISRLAADGVQVNVTALLTVDQVRTATQALAGGASSYISVFAGRIADTGRDPLPLMCEALEIMAPHPNLELIWASPREILNVVQADSIGCHVITVTHDMLKKLSLLGRELEDFSLDTVRMFHRDALAAGFAV
jgi:transaldolase